MFINEVVTFINCRFQHEHFSYRYAIIDLDSKLYFSYQYTFFISKSNKLI